ncbi:gliding motility-associated C-terminal domain-containing protein [Mucilaginibacter terrigena]|uniref:Gliding motility-associated C-terminal domain-containing protein n=1 Tax=Mucilaginibacter terrigena TaxID=2492395 RepID=A0A4Q5LLN8_9SPHI|nr:gliding motility-associated C-terminal domain-containing protein [Mucilaginibacter terrigena]RYU90566.1 gliding motility-associated C-terminal domain-containing protein [Mucilaginibacter terrigena]
MLVKKFLLFITLLLLSSQLLFADTFTVTSNADSGPGTLREALTLAAANGSAVKDYIVFNIPSLTEAGRTILLRTDLPYVSSDVVIDGTTQPGAGFGVSNSKIKITVNRQQFRTAQIVDHACSAALFILNAQNVEIYGLYITNFYALTSIYGYDATPGAAIYLSNTKNTKIGAPGKGNVLFDNEYGIAGGFFGDGQNSFVEVKGNFIECDADGKSVSTVSYTVNSGIWVYASDVLIGGDLPGDRNYLGYCNNIINTGGNNYSIINNYIAVDYFNNAQLNEDGVTVSGHVNVGGDNLLFRNNVFSYMLMTVSAKNFKMYSNTDKGPAPNRNPIIEIRYAENGIIGSDDITEINSITGNPFSSAIAAYSSKNIRILKNSIICSDYAYYTDDPAAPKIAIIVNNDTELSGTATPNSLVYIYEDNRDCPVCSPVQFYTTTAADAAGNWKITGNFVNKKWVANTTLQQTSSEFTQPRFPYFDNSNSTVKNPTCGANNGSIAISKYKYILNIKWFNENDEEVGQGNNVGNLKPGTYYAIGYNGNCSARSDPFTLYDIHPVIFDGSKKIVNPSCGAGGSIKGLFASTNSQNTASYTWAEKIAGTVGNTIDIENLPAGEYTLTVTDDVTHCTAQYGPITLTNTSGPQINQSSYVTSPSSCSTASGAIHGITAAGTNVKYSWKNEAMTEVGTSADLDGVPAGNYTLTVTDDSNCGPVTSSPVEILSVSDISINTDTKNVQDAHCDNPDGSITGITVTGTGTYLWTNEQGTGFGNDINLTGAPAGKYKLTVTSAGCPPVSTELIEIKSVNGVSLDLTEINVVSTTCEKNNGSIKGLQTINATSVEWRRKSDNAFVAGTLDIINQPAGNYVLTIKNATCSKSYDFTIEQLPTIVFPDFAPVYTKSCAAFGTGTITLNTGAGEQPVAYRWVNSEGTRVGYTNKAEFLPAGDYKLYLTDKNGCENFYKDYHVDAYPNFNITYGSITQAQCGVSTGSVSATLVSGGTSNYTYQWLDGNRDPIPGKNQPSIDNLAPGTYTLRITDGGCNLAEPEFTITDVSVDPPTPSVTNIDRCSAGTAVITVNDAYPTAKYRLYETATSAQPIDEQQGGKFTVSVTESKTYYVSLTYGTCESLRAEVKVLLGSITSGIPNTFTPNGDGTNDFWKIKGIENYTNGTVSVFSRDGQLVFQSKGYAVPFDGTRNGKPLPAGVYYYIIDLKSCDLITGNLTILR